MQIEREPFSFGSANGEDTVKGVCYIPNGVEPVGVVQFSHGMVEHIGRYEEVMTALAQQGFAVYGHDHLGHGSTASNPERLGYFAPQDGARCLIADLYHITEMAKERFPGLPVTLVGHSMGSLVARLYCLDHGGELARAVFVGTPAKNRMAGAGLAVAKGISRWKSPQARSPFLDRLTMGMMNRSVRSPRTAKDWLSRDEARVDQNIADPFCNFVFTASAFAELYDMTRKANSAAWFESFPKQLPVYLLTGEADPVGGSGKGVQHICDRLRRAGVQVWIKRYPGARHELFHETNRQEVIGDLLAILSGGMEREV